VKVFCRREKSRDGVHQFLSCLCRYRGRQRDGHHLVLVGRRLQQQYAPLRLLGFAGRMSEERPMDDEELRGCMRRMPATDVH